VNSGVGGGPARDYSTSYTAAYSGIWVGPYFYCGDFDFGDDKLGGRGGRGGHGAGGVGSGSNGHTYFGPLDVAIVDDQNGRLVLHGIPSLGGGANGQNGFGSGGAAGGDEHGQHWHAYGHRERQTADRYDGLPELHVGPDGELLEQEGGPVREATDPVHNISVGFGELNKPQSPFPMDKDGQPLRSLGDWAPLTEALDRLARDRQLHTLCICGVPLSREICMQLGDLLPQSRLQHLQLARSVDPSMLGNVMQGVNRSRLTSLDLCDNALTDANLDSIIGAMKNHTMQSISLCLNHISPEGARILSDEVNTRNNWDSVKNPKEGPCTTPLLKLDLRGCLNGRGVMDWNPPTLSGADKHHHARAIQYHNRAKALNLIQEQFSDPGIALARQDAQRWEQEVLARAAARAGARVPRPTLRKPAMRTTASRYDNLFNNL